MRLAFASILGFSSLLAAVWAMGTVPVTAHTPHPGLDFSIGVAGVPGCDTTQGGKTCTLASGTPFTVNVTLGPLPSDIVNYDGFDLHVTFTGAELQGQPSTNAWPDCGFTLSGPRPGDLLFGCAIGLPPAESSTYSGSIGTVNFTCTTSGSIVLVNGEGDTDLSQFNGITEVLHTDPTATETLTINCSSAGPTPIQTPTPSAPTPTEVNPGTLAEHVFDAINRGDLPGAMTFFADDAVMQGFPDCASPCTGQAIQQGFQAITTAHLHVTITHSDVYNIIVDGRFEATSDVLRGIGIDRILGEFTFQRRGNKIAFAGLYLDANDSQTARFIAYYSGSATGAPSRLPGTGSRAAYGGTWKNWIGWASAIGSVGILTFLAGLFARGLSRRRDAAPIGKR